MVAGKYTQRKRLSQMKTEKLFGRQPVLEALRAGRRQVSSLLFADGVRAGPQTDEIEQLAQRHHLTIQRVPGHRLQQIAAGGNHQGVALECGPFPYAAYAEVRQALVAAIPDEPILLLLDRIQDPQNLGSLLRSAECAGVTAVMLPTERAAHITPAVVRASAGATERLAITLSHHLPRSMQEFRELGFSIWGLAAAPDAVPLGTLPGRGPLALVVGNEGRGLRQNVQKNCDHLVRIPLYGTINSLNAGVAGAVAMFQIRFLRETHARR